MPSISPVNIYVDDCKNPEIAFTSPKNNDQIDIGVVNLIGNASDDDGIDYIEIWVDTEDNKLRVELNGVTTYNFNTNDFSVESGVHTAYAIAYDLAGNKSNTASVSFFTTDILPIVAKPDVTTPMLICTQPFTVDFGDVGKCKQILY